MAQLKSTVIQGTLSVTDEISENGATLASKYLGITGKAVSASAADAASSVPWTGVTNRPGNATTSAAGLMSAADKIKLDAALTGITANQVTGALGFNPATRDAATTSATGLMSAADKAKLDGIASGANKYVLPAATTGALGGVIVGNNLTITSTGKLDATDTTYGNATTSAAGLMSAEDKVALNTANTKLVYYGTCATAKATQAKAATLVNGDNFTLTPGVCVAIKFTYAAAAAPMTLSVNGTTACTIMQYGTTQASSGTTTSGWPAGAVVLFVYDGTYWYRSFWSNTTYSNMTQTEADTGTATSARSISASVLATTINNRIAGKEDSSNKVTSLSSESTDTEYPSAKSVYDALQAVNISAETTGSGNVISSISAATGVITAVKGITALTAETPLSTAASGSGNVVTDITVSGHQITKVKGITALTAHPTITTSTDTTGTTSPGSAGTFNAVDSVTRDSNGHVTKINTTKVTMPTIPTSLPASNTVDTYTSTSTAPISGKGVAAALATLDVNSVGGTDKYISTISETDGKISATAVTFSTAVKAIKVDAATAACSASSVEWSAVQNKVNAGVSAVGLVTTGAQSFAGKKSFTNDIAVGNANLVYTTSGTDKILTISFS